MSRFCTTPIAAVNTAAITRRLFDEPIRQRLGQCRDGELLLVAQDRTNSMQNLSDKRRGKSRRVRLHRTLLQREASSFDDWISEPYGVRDQGWISLSGCHPNRVQAKVMK